MGRVAKYKKVKSFDPYSKKNRGNIELGDVGVWGLGDDGRRKKKRSQKAEKMHARKMKQKSKRKGNVFDDGGFDVPPSEKDEFDMADLIGSIKRQKVEKNLLGTSSSMPVATKTKKEATYDQIVTSDGKVANIPKTAEDETKVNKMLKLDQQITKQSEQKKEQSHARMEGESKNAFNKRVRAETRQIIKSTNTVKNHEKLARKKEFLKAKKKRKKGGNAAYTYDNDAEIAQVDEKIKKREAAADVPVLFNEQADRPPIFRQIPRGAKKKSNTSTIKLEQAKKPGMSEVQIQAENNAMELMRRRIQAQYKAIKSQRKDNGDFHL